MSIQSMTGFGSGKAEADGIEVVTEIRTVNHRFLDVVFRTPNSYNTFEAELLKDVRKTLTRGRVEIHVSRSDSQVNAYKLSFNEELFKSHLKAYEKAASLSGLDKADVLSQAVAQLLGKREVLELESPETDETSELPLVKKSLGDALKALSAMRAAEGKALEKEVLGLVDDLETQTDKVKEVTKNSVSEYNERLTARLSKLDLVGVSVEPDRLAQEVAIFSDRIDITEELTRLKSHFSQFRQIVKDNEGGRKLEFLLQEFGREINTIGSKSQTSDVTPLIVEAKSLVEKLKEQAANIE